MESDFALTPTSRCYGNCQFATSYRGYFQLWAPNNDAKFLAKLTPVPEPPPFAFDCAAGVDLLLARKRLNREA